MKPFYTFILIALLSSTVWSQEERLTAETTTYYFIRHAEKDRTDATNKNPELNILGEKRAVLWRDYFKNIDFDVIYSTSYKRTQQTAEPTAIAKKLAIKNYDPVTLYSPKFKKDTKGKRVLIVGHSNTTPAFVNMILGHTKYKDIDDNDNSKLFIITILGDQITDQVLSIN
jgi:broad specificity phosphatase PhoE